MIASEMSHQMNSINSNIIKDFPRSGVGFVEPFYRVADQYLSRALIDGATYERAMLLPGTFFSAMALKGVAEATSIYIDDDDLRASISAIATDARAMYYFSIGALRDYCIFSREYTINCSLRGYSNDRARNHRAVEKYNYLRDLPIYRDFMIASQQAIIDSASGPMQQYLVNKAIPEFYETLTYVMQYCQQDNTITEEELEKSYEIIDTRIALGLSVAHSCVLGPVNDNPPKRPTRKARMAAA